MASPSEEEIAQLWAIHNSDERRRELLLRSYGFDSTRSWVDPNGYTLSTRVWRARRAIYDQIDAVLRDAIARGTDALEVADILEQFLAPELSPVRNALGRLIRNQKPVIVTRAPGRGGMGSFSARRLARTEITRAHGMATIETAKRTPFAVGVKWNLSGSHPRSDPCDENSRRDEYRLGPGVYPPEKVPQYPNHPQCLCNLSTATENDVDSVVARLREQYGLSGAGDAFVESATLPDAEAFARSVGVQSVDYGGAFTYGKEMATKRLNAANTTNRALQILRDRGIPLPPRILAFADKGSDSIAHFNARGTGQITLNLDGRFWTNPERGLRRLREDGFLVAESPHEVVVHEVGHYNHWLRRPEISQAALPLTEAETAIAARVSHYAAADQSEFVAEVFTGLIRGEQYDDDIMDLYRRLKGPDV